MDTKDKDKKHEGCCGGHDHQEGCCGEHEHDHDHDHYDEEPITLDLVLDDGEEVQCEVVGIFEVEDKEYIALLPQNDDRVLLYVYDEQEDDLVLENIEDEEEFKKVSETFWEIFGDGELEEEEE